MYFRKNQLLKNRKKLLQVSLWLSSCIFLSCLFSYTLHSFAWSNQIDLKISDALLRFRNRESNKNDDIITLNFKSEKYYFPSLKEEQDAYAEIIKWLLQNKTKVVVINIPSRWTENKDLLIKNQSKSDKLAQLLDNPLYRNKIVLVGYTPPLNPNVELPIPDYIPLLGAIDDFSQDAYLKVADIQGFIEFDPISSIDPDNLNSPSRSIHLEGNFQFAYPTQPIQKFKSFAVLAIEKYSPSNHLSIPNLETIQINYLKRNSFQEQTIKSICFNDELNFQRQKNIQCQTIQDNILPSDINNKIVILDFNFESQGEGKANTIQVKSSFDWHTSPVNYMSSLEYQANIVSTLLTHSYYQILEPQGVYLISSLIGCIEFFIIFFVQRKIKIYVLSSVLLAYILVIIIIFWLHYILPFSTLVISSILTGLAAYLIDKNNQLLQEDERNKKLLAEEEATILQAKKLILRIWSDIHDDSLQELRVAMDDIELSNLSDFERRPILKRLSYVGMQIRKHLEIEAVQELSLQSLLREGLVSGINSYLDNLVASGKLTLPVIRDLQSIQEFETNSHWLDAREDIFRFFREQIANVIAHAQGRDTTATQVKINLSQTGDQCLLVIENDGKNTRDIDNDNHGGLGTKLSQEMTESLPDGHWRRIDLLMGGVSVELRWKHSFQR